MPRNVRNFWLEGTVDGRKSKIGTGPVKRDGGFDLSILIREEGDISSGRLEIVGSCVSDPKTGEFYNILDVSLMNGSHVVKEIRLKVARDEGGTKVSENKLEGEVGISENEPKGEGPKRDGAFWEIK